jgi:hypothetical protein
LTCCGSRKRYLTHSSHIIRSAVSLASRCLTPMRHQASSHTHLAAVVTTHFIRLFSSDLRGNIREIFKYEKPYKAGPTHFQVPTSLIRLHTLPCVCSLQHDTHAHTHRRAVIGSAARSCSQRPLASRT